MEAIGGGGAGHIRTQTSQERKRTSQAQADQDQANAQAAAFQQEIDRVRAQIAAEAKSVPAATVLQAQHAGHAQATISTGSLVSVVCEGWAIAAAPLAKENLRYAVQDSNLACILTESERSLSEGLSGPWVAS
eukprot:SAG22_NODE_29_length_28404_cov_23.294153_8_plen_133_part_00